jgi:hypothetical protein
MKKIPKQNLKKYEWRTKAYRQFMQHFWRTEELLHAGITGLEEERKPIENISAKFDNVKTPRGKPPKNYEPFIKLIKSDKKEKFPISMKMDQRSATIMRKAVLYHLEVHKDLNYHYHAIMCVSIWGSYETYLYMLFEELFSKQPRMLKTNESISYNEAFMHKDNIVKYLSEKSLKKIGHFNLTESLSYSKEKINFKYTKQRENNLHKIYLIRNIVAHNSGVLRPGQEKEIPQGIAIKENELRISRTYLKRIHSIIKVSVTILEKHVEEKFYKQNA